MKNNYVMALILGVLVVGGVVAFNMMGQDSNSSENKKIIESNNGIVGKVESGEMADKLVMDDSILVDDMTKEQMDGEPMDLGGKYVAHTPENLIAAAENRRVLYFYADWCPTCRPTDQELQANQSELPGDLTVIRVNYDDSDTDQDERELAQQYGITSQHTFVQIDENGEEITKWNGGQLDELLDNIK